MLFNHQQSKQKRTKVSSFSFQNRKTRNWRTFLGINKNQEMPFNGMNLIWQMHQLLPVWPLSYITTSRPADAPCRLFKCYLTASQHVCFQTIKLKRLVNKTTYEFMMNEYISQYIPVCECLHLSDWVRRGLRWFADVYLTPILHQVTYVIYMSCTLVVWNEQLENKPFSQKNRRK